MATHNLLLLPGDGIGPEVMAEVKRVIDFFNKKGPDKFITEEALVGGCCYDAHGVAITDATMEKAKAADAVIFGAVGGPKWDKVPLRRAARGRLASTAQGSRAVRQHPSRPSFILRLPIPPRSSARWSRGSTSLFCAN